VRRVFIAAIVIAGISDRAVPAQPVPRAQPIPPATRPAHPAPPALPAPAKPKLFDPLDLGLLEAPDRDQWWKPDQVMDALLIAEGSKVADVGAGGGWFTIHLSRRVGPNGVVYAEDIQPEMIEAISRRVQRENLTNVKPVLGMPNDPRLPQGLDAVLIADSYPEMDDPPGAAVPLLKNVARSLKPQGRLGIVNFKPGGGGPGPAERVAPEAVIERAAEAGLQLIKREEVPPFLYLLVFGRVNARGQP
jgi:ubiquinone/menaquinone biosynthesis C-methylase UbiE